MQWRIPLADIDFGLEEEAAVMKVLRDRWLTMGEITREFEEAFAARVRAEHALAVSNGTVALHLACLAAGIGPGDEVILPSLTFVATANAVLYTGARVRFADIYGPHNLNISPAEIKRRINSRTKAIIVVHYGGYPCDMAAIMGLAAQHQLIVIEDAAHAPGASLDQKPLGSWGDIGCFSFFSNKNMTTGEGGMLVTNREDVADKVRLLRSHGMTTLTWDRHQGHANSYDVVLLGYNYRMDELRSALGLVQLKKLDANNLRRKELTALYRQTFQGSGIHLPFSGSLGEPAYHLLPVLLPREVDRERFMASMREQAIQTSVHYPPIHTFRYYRPLASGCVLPATEDVARREVTLPLFPTMSDEDVQAVVSAACTAIEEQTKR